MNTTTLHRAIVLALAAPLALTACGGGGGMVRSSPAPVSPPPAAPPSNPPPPTKPTAPPPACPIPVTGNCLVVGPAMQYFAGGVQSNFALTVGDENSTGTLNLLLGDDSRFSGGTVIRNGTLSMSGGSVHTGVDPASVDGTILESDVVVGERGNFYIKAGGRTHAGILKGSVQNRGVFELYGRVDGHVENYGSATIGGTVGGNVLNHGSATFSGVVGGSWLNDGRLDVGDAIDGPTFNRIAGDFRQSGNGLLSILLPSEGPDWGGAYTSTLYVGGRADIDGVLELRRAWYNDHGAWYGYLLAPLPTAPISIQLLHADGGVFGAFTGWQAANWLDENDVPRPLFIAGSLRYGSNDVWFDLTRVSIQTAMSGQSFNGMTLASAANLDRALTIADRFAATPNTTQSRFLQSAGQLLWLDDAQQAARSLDSLAGLEHAQLATDAQLRSSQAAGQLAMHAGARRLDGLPSHWSLPLAGGRLDGYDQWLGPRTLVGGSVGREASTANGASSNEQRASLYLHHRGDRWQGTLVASAGRGTSLLQRRIDLGDRRARIAGAQHRIDLADLHAELARPFAWAGGELQPYTAIDAGMVRGSGFLEQGDTGFELTSKGGVFHQLGAALGLRYMRDWRIGAQRVQLLADLQRAQRLQAGGQWQAAFLGVPDAAFDLRDWSDPRSHSARLSLQAGTPGGWQWAFSGLRDSHRGASTAWQLRFGRDF